MKALAALAFLVVSACASTSAVSRTTPTTGQPQPTCSQQGVTAASPSPLAGGGGSLQQPTPSAAVPHILAVMVDLFAGCNTYDVALVASDGRVAARTRAQKRTMIADASELPYVSASNSRIYFLDGDHDIRYLKADGTSGLVTTVPGTASVHAAFAVTPDDARIAVSLLDYSANPVALTLYVEDLGGAHHAVIFTSNNRYVWPAGWHAGELVVAYIGPSATPFKSKMSSFSYLNRSLIDYPYGPNPYGGENYHVIDPATAQRQAIVSGGGASGLPNKVGTAVVQGQAVDWNGQVIPWNSPQDYGAYSASGSISPNGRIIAACCSSPGTNGQLVLWYRGGESTVLQVHVTAIDWVGWFDDSHLITGFYQRSDGNPNIVDITSNQVTTVDAHGIVAAMLPGSLDG